VVPDSEGLRSGERLDPGFADLPIVWDAPDIDLKTTSQGYDTRTAGPPDASVIIQPSRFIVFFDSETLPYTSERTPHTAYPWTNAYDGLVRLLEAAASAIVRMCAMC
jgi:hypothetical protein